MCPINTSGNASGYSNYRVYLDECKCPDSANQIETMYDNERKFRCAPSVTSDNKCKEGPKGWFDPAVSNISDCTCPSHALAMYKDGDNGYRCFYPNTNAVMLDYPPHNN